MDMIPWLTLILLGAFHGLNPGMGWLFAVAVGLQERRRTAVIRALGPIAIGHAAAVALVAAFVGLIGLLVPIRFVEWAGAIALVTLGLYKLLVPMSHPRWVGMRVRGRQLAVWSFLMASAHGAGLMLVPWLIDTGDGDPMVQNVHAHDHAEHLQAVSSTASGYRGIEILSVLVHSAAMLLVMGAIAVVVFDRLGLSLLRRRWLNVDRIWAVMLTVSGVIALAI
jgi:threonine/homoserine/homoserine lactone efflux protein